VAENQARPPDKIVIASLTAVAYSDGSCDVVTAQDHSVAFNDSLRGFRAIAKDIGRQIRERVSCPFYEPLESLHCE